MSDERTPLLRSGSALSDDDPHHQFCLIVGVPPSNHPTKPKVPLAPSRALHAFMASLSTTALLAQVVIGAAVTALGASQSNYIFITVFGATNTVIAGIVAYLKSRGQPMRTRMFRDDLQRVVDEIENSETMWLGITKGIHGYDEIDIDDKVTVRSEVARLMRLYERAVRNNSLNNPDNYLLANSDAAGTALRARSAGVTGSAAVTLPVTAPEPPASTAPAPSIAAPAAPPSVPVEDPDESPASAAPKPPTSSPQEAPKEPAKDAPAKSPEPEVTKDPAKDASKYEAKPTSPPPAAPQAPIDPDESPATSANPPSIPHTNTKSTDEPNTNGKAPGLSSDDIAGAK